MLSQAFADFQGPPVGRVLLASVAGTPASRRVSTSISSQRRHFTSWSVLGLCLRTSWLGVRSRRAGSERIERYVDPLVGAGRRQLVATAGQVIQARMIEEADVNALFLVDAQLHDLLRPRGAAAT